VTVRTNYSNERSSGAASRRRYLQLIVRVGNLMDWFDIARSI